MKFLLDTCVVSELIKKSPNKNVLRWLENQDEEDLYLSVLTFGEIQKGIEKAPDKIRKKKLQAWLEKDLRERFEGKIIPVDLNVAIKWGEIQGITEKEGKTMPSIDGLIAISALAYGCTVVTRNTSDMENSTVDLLNPWEM
jgi:predicted nucleic acid-binding protein